MACWLMAPSHYLKHDLSWVRPNGIHAKVLWEDDLKIPFRKTVSKLHFENHIQIHQGSMSSRVVVWTHYNAVIMGAIASQITSLTIVYNRLFRRRSKKASKLRVTGLCAENSPGTGEFPAQMASNAENVSIWWRHHVWPVVVGDAKWDRVIKICGIHSPEWRCQLRAPVVLVIYRKAWTYDTWLNTPRGSLAFWGALRLMRIFLI